MNIKLTIVNPRPGNNNTYPNAVFAQNVRYFLLLSWALFTLKVSAQTAPVEVVENTLKIGGLSEETFYYGFAEGDQLIFTFDEVNNKELKEVEIIEYPSSSKFMDYKTKRIGNKIITVNKTGIYKFRFANSALLGRVCKFRIQRIPSSDKYKTFNTSVYWRTVYDTTYREEEERYLVRIDTISEDFYSSMPQISSQNALNGNSNRQVIDFVLPHNTVSWSFYIGTGKKSKEALDKAQTSFLKSSSKALSTILNYGPMTALALTGVSYISAVQGEDNVKYWFLSDYYSVTQFQNNQTFMQYKKGDVINEACQMKSPLKGKVYIGLLNDNTFDPIAVIIKATAVVVNEQWGTRTVRRMLLSSREEAYLKN